MSYLLTKNGLNPKPVTTNIGLKYDKSIYNTIGYMKISSDSKKLAVAINGFQTVQVFDFDSQSGILSKPTTLKLKPDLSPYGIEFSPNSSLLYIGVVTKGLIYQVNLKAENEQAIQKSLCLIGQSKNKKNVGSLQLAIDGKIYIAEYQSKFISAIEHPDTLGVGCSFKPNAIFLNEKICMFGLPTFFQDYVKSNNSKKKTQILLKETEIKINTKYILDNVYFDFNQSILRYRSTQELMHLVEYLRNNSKLKIEIIGHTDSIGSLVYNNKLSLIRAREVKKYFTNKGISSNRITFSGKGFVEPIAPNSEEIGRQKNRRVEFILTES
jgi:outer membrane protein OmpA-like peptidoglycan-associated protein